MANNLRQSTPREEFPSPFEFGRHEPITLVELRMRRFSGKIRSKANWWEKVNDAVIVAKWREEIVDLDRQLVDKLWGGEGYYEHGDGKKKWPREPITDAQINYIFAELEYVASKRDPETGIFATSIGKVCESHSLISAELKGHLVKSVAPLENVHEDEQDWHPGSNRQVLDLVHPSLYCLRIGSSLVRTPEKVEVGKGVVKVIAMDDYIHHRPDLSPEFPWSDWALSTEYQWLPTDFSVSSWGEVKCLGYINNIHPTHRVSLYHPVTAILGRFVPMFEHVLSETLSADPELAVQIPFDGWYEEEPPEDLETDEEWDAWDREHRWPTIHDPLPFQPQPERERVQYSLKDRNIQVIIKIANIVLSPENPKYPGGAWHVEGMANENIVATGLYYYACENITESRLDFRTIVGSEDATRDLPYEQHDHRGYVVAYGFGRDHALNQDLGHIVAEEDKCIAFPNIYQHHVDAFELADPSKPGYRKILAFFLVNPDTPILSTTDVPPQQEDWVFAELEDAPSLKKLPQELFDIVTGYVKEGVISRREAEEHRARLMKERSAFVMSHNEHVYEVEFNMCEH